MKIERILGSGLFLLAGWACSSDNTKSGDSAVVANNFTKGVGITGGMSVNGPQPAGSDTASTQIQGIGSAKADATPITVKPGQSAMINLAWAGGPINGFNVGFGGQSYFSVPMPMTQNAGTAMVMVTIAGNVCDNLTSICHQISCYEQVQLPDGMTVSKQKTQMMVLDCSPNGCGGGGPPDAGGGLLTDGGGLPDSSVPGSGINLSNCGFLSGYGAVDPGGDNNQCGQCLLNNCASEYDACYGTGWRNGDFGGGACGSDFACLCHCHGDACENCMTSTACASCLTTAYVCHKYTCGKCS